MSSIQKMSIQGIRSFGPDDSDKQVIQFFAPLTLILGPNGTGKTTIIECLKYMTTGELPPNSKLNAAFIHDPKVAMETEVKAQIRLQFRDVRRQQVTAIRTMTATQRAKKTEMKTLDSVITRINEQGEKCSISSRCAEMDREVVALLGVAKPVLDYVIFCHQEESNWPLSEGKALKQKFDDIFASTRYVKALDVIRLTKKDQTVVIREMAAEMKYLKQNKNKAAELTADLDETEARFIASKEAVDEIDTKLEPIQEQLETLGRRANEVFKMKTEIEKFRAEKSQMEKGVQELQNAIESEFSGSDAALERELAEHGEALSQRQERLTGLEHNLNSLDSEQHKASKLRSTLMVQQAKLEEQAERQQQMVTKRNKLLEKLVNEYHLEGLHEDITQDDVQSFLEQLDSQAKEILNQSKQIKAEYEQKESAAQKNVDAKRSNKTKLETEIKIKKDSLKSNAGEIKEINQKLSRVEASADRLKNLMSELKSVQRERSDIENAVDVNALKKQLKDLEDQKLEYDGKLKSLDTEISRLSAESSIRSKLEVFKKDQAVKVDSIRRLRSKNEDNVKQLLGQMPEQNLLRNLNEYINQHSQNVRASSRKLEELKRKLAGLNMDRKNQMEQLKKKEAEQQEHADKIMEICESQNVNDEMDRAEQEMSKQQAILAYVRGTEHVYSKFVATMERQQQHECPLCHQKFDTEAMAEELIQSMESKLSLVPSKVAETEQKLDHCKKKYEDMLQLKPVRSSMLDIETKDLPDLRNKVKMLNENIEKIKNEISDQELLVETLQADEVCAKSMQTDMSMIDRYHTELRDLERQMSTLSAQISTEHDSGRSLSEVSQQREDVQLQLESVSRSIDRERNRHNHHLEQLHSARDRVNQLEREKLQIESDMQQRSRLEQRKEEVLDMNEVLETEIVECDGELQPLQAAIKQLVQEKDTISRQKEHRMEEDRDKFNQIKTKGKEVGTLNKEVQRYISAGIADEQKEVGEQLQQAADNLQRVVRRQEQTATEREELQKQLADQQLQQRMLKDNVTLREKKCQVKKKQQQLDQAQDKMGDLKHVSNLAKEEHKLRKQLEKMLEEKHTVAGRRQGFKDEISRLRKQLQDEMYVDAECKHNTKMIELRTTEMASADLDKYYRALDKAIMTYHTSKMREINKIIRELWRKTYKGNDIDSIEIRSDDEGPAAANKRRVYHYRVVMVKGEAALDMRGRCSAGQKVLSSLIIRLALAETFCINCGILALDEPTTNLDRENIESLAYALVEIIKSRQKQRNFQLIIITHDEDFVELLGRSDYVEEFFKVRKNDVGCSVLLKARVQDLHTR